ncbi:class I adenylate-forming enzyme family protein [Bacillus mycoides]|uniref:AMP-dependent synthetase n=1 Tax=Bacillus mycoides TaxID=1405 RepID=A0A1S9T200_BACMY|nr:class I adenylate-forming enzyme family protein [Bacillus mycoides]OOR03661.1 AMP-dependent synthetase [Bacillus mycoides]
MRFIHDLLEKSVFDSPEKFAVVTKDYAITYQEVREKSYQIGNFLYDKGIKKGDRVLIKLPNSIDLILLLFGLSRVGGIAVIINPNTTQHNQNYIIKDCSPKLIIVQDTNLLDQDSTLIMSIKHLKNVLSGYDKSDMEIRDLKETDISLLIYTSGSTGKPKAVMCAHHNILFCVRTISESLQINNNDIIGNFLPLSFDYGLYQIFISFYKGATLALGEANLAGLMLVKYLKEWRVTVFPSIPHLTEGLIKLLPRYKNELPLRIITNTGENLPQVYINKIEELMPNCNVYPMYGLTECKRVSILKPNELKDKVGSVGRPLPQVQCYIVDNNRNIMGFGQTGQLVVKGPNVMQGYWNNKVLTQEKFERNNLEPTNTLYTGDLFKMDSDGYLYFVGRTDDIYKHKGFRVSSKEIEEAIYELNLAQIAVLIPPDSTYKKSRLFVQTDKSITLIKKALKNRLEYYKIPDEIIVLNKFPTTINKKIDKLKLKEIRS